jgi:hypothetical protein
MNKIFTLFISLFLHSFLAHSQQNAIINQQIQLSNTNADNLTFTQSLILLQFNSTQLQSLISFI